MTTKAYGRVSTDQQDLTRQLLKFQELGIEEEHIYMDKASGKNFDRPEYQVMKESIKEGDLLYLDALDRLGRDYDGILSEWKEITRKMNADIVILENKELFDSRKFKAMGDMGKLMEDQFLSLLSYVAEQERKRMLQRQKEGIAIAKAAGKYKGKPRKYTEKNASLIHAVELYQQGDKTVKEIVAITKVSRSSFYEYLKENDIKRNA
ncbi:recombinase family protein [Neobacillus pocheonensis]|uniref:Recombinase family protein n=1 Tax=Neobacillus pocheonensis TaxID=363869 RepID=A0ABT0WFV3_9BACI|nr:recombinase family protein [Neobacillus pocheonensis]